MLSDTARFDAILHGRPRKGRFLGAKINPSLAYFIPVAPFEGNVPCIRALDTEIGIDNLEEVTLLLVAAHNLKASIVALLFAFLHPKLITSVTASLCHAPLGIARSSQWSARGTFQAPLHHMRNTTYLVRITKTVYCKQHNAIDTHLTLNGLLLPIIPFLPVQLHAKAAECNRQKVE